MSIPRLLGSLGGILLLVLIGGCSKSTDEQMAEYLEFYYPTTGQNYYEIIFDWGKYVVVTEARVDEEVHPDAAKYRGYITMRPSIGGYGEEKFPIYLATPEGDVWITNLRDEIAASRRRQEVTVDGNATTTTTIDSVSEPIIDDFLADRSYWLGYGRLEKSGGGYKIRRPSD